MSGLNSVAHKTIVQINLIFHGMPVKCGNWIIENKNNKYIPYILLLLFFLELQKSVCLD